MATILDKDLIRESTIKFDNREIMVTIAADQKIKFKLKGMKSGEVSIDIEALYKQLTGNDIEEVVEDKVVKAPIVISNEDDEEDYSSKSGILIDLNDLRSANAISMLDMPTLTKFDGIITELLKQQKEINASIKNIRTSTKKKK